MELWNYEMRINISHKNVNTYVFSFVVIVNQHVVVIRPVVILMTISRHSSESQKTC